MFLLSDVTALALEFSPCLLLNGHGALLYRGKEAGTSNWPIISASMHSKSDLLPPGFLADLFNCRDNCLLRCNIVKCHKITYVSEESFCFHLQGRKLIYTSRHFWQTRDDNIHIYRCANLRSYLFGHAAWPSISGPIDWTSSFFIRPSGFLISCTFFLLPWHSCDAVFFQSV